MRTKLIYLLVAVALLAACAPTTPTPTASDNPLGDAVYIDSADLLIMESYPVQVALTITGNLPTPCHAFFYQYEIQNFGDELRVDVNAYSVADEDAVCTQVLQPFEERVSFDLSNAAEGTYVVYLNGEKVGEFTYPA